MRPKRERGDLKGKSDIPGKWDLANVSIRAFLSKKGVRKDVHTTLDAFWVRRGSQMHVTRPESIKCEGPHKNEDCSVPKASFRVAKRCSIFESLR